MKNFLLVALTLLMFGPGAYATRTDYDCKKVENMRLEELAYISSQAMKVGNVIETKVAAPFDIAPYKGKTVVFLVSATWCGYCKYDIYKLGEWRKKENWPKDDIAFIHMIVPSSRQDLVTAEAFLADPKIQGERLHLDGTDFYYSATADFKDFEAMQTSKGDTFFPNLRGTPYAIIFDKNGDARFRGHYTYGDGDHSAYYDEHFDFIGKVAKGECE